MLGQLLKSLLQDPRNFSEVAPEVRPAVHTAPVCHIGGSRRAPDYSSNLRPPKI